MERAALEEEMISLDELNLIVAKDGNILKS